MHEYSIVEALISRIEEEMERQGASAVHRVEVRIGDMAGVERELLAAAWDTFREGTCCAKAPLQIHGAPARWGCGACGGALEAGEVLRCPACGGAGTLVGGGELLLERIELEVA